MSCITSNQLPELGVDSISSQLLSGLRDRIRSCLKDVSVQVRGSCKEDLKGGIAVPRDEIEVRGEFAVVQAVVSAHHVCRDRHLGAELPKRGRLVEHELEGLIGDESAPVNAQAMQSGFPVRLAGGLDLVPIGIGVAPKGGPISLVESVKIALELLVQPLPEGGSALRTVVLASIFVAEVPGEKSRVFAITFGKGSAPPGWSYRDRLAEPKLKLTRLPWSRRTRSTPVLRVSGYFLESHAGGAALGVCEDEPSIRLFKLLDCLVKPTEIVLAFGRFEASPSEHAHGCDLAVGKPHQAHVFLHGGFRPLLGAVVASMPKEQAAWNLANRS